MINLIKEIKKKTNGVVISLFSTGILLIILGILIIVNDLIFRLLVALFIFIVSYTFLYGAYKLWTIKKEIEKYFDK